MTLTERLKNDTANPLIDNWGTGNLKHLRVLRLGFGNFEECVGMREHFVRRIIGCASHGIQHNALIFLGGQFSC